MNKSEFLQIQHPHQWAKDLRSIANKMMLINAFLVELRECKEDIYAIPESNVNYKKEANKEMFKLITTQIDGLVYSSFDLNNRNFELLTVSEFLEDLELPEI